MPLLCLPPIVCSGTNGEIEPVSLVCANWFLKFYRFAEPENSVHFTPLLCMLLALMGSEWVSQDKELAAWKNEEKCLRGFCIYLLSCILLAPVESRCISQSWPIHPDPMGTSGMRSGGGKWRKTHIPPKPFSSFPHAAIHAACSDGSRWTGHNMVNASRPPQSQHLALRWVSGEMEEVLPTVVGFSLEPVPRKGDGDRGTGISFYNFWIPPLSGTNTAK